MSNSAIFLDRDGVIYNKKLESVNVHPDSIVKDLYDFFTKILFRKKNKV